MEDNLLTAVVNSDVFLYIIASFGILLVAIWVALIYWTFQDAKKRYKEIYPWIIFSTLVFLGGIFGIIIYLIIRPSETINEKQDQVLERDMIKDFSESEKIKCLGCKKEVLVAFNFCPHCQEKLKHQCSQCDEYVEFDHSFCPACSTKIKSKIKSKKAKNRKTKQAKKKK